MKTIANAVVAVFLTFLASAALATPEVEERLPALFDVTDVAQNDVLNVRAEPSASAAQIGALGPNATGIEIVALSESGTWGLLNLHEGAGWVSMRFLEATGGPDWANLTTPLYCYGTEPFWNATLERTNPTLETMNDGMSSLALKWVTPVWGHYDAPSARSVAISLTRQGDAGMAVVRAESCNDGMSDREMGLSINMFFESETGNAQFANGSYGYSGCCSISAP